jgi:hypothetical protein
MAKRGTEWLAEAALGSKADAIRCFNHAVKSRITDKDAAVLLTRDHPTIAGQGTVLMAKSTDATWVTVEPSFYS